MITYIITAPAGLSYSAAAESLVLALGCTTLTHDWNGSDELKPGTCAFTSRTGITPPERSHSLSLATEDEVIELAADIYTLRRDPPHIEHALQRITFNIGGQLSAQWLRDYHNTLRQRLNNTFMMYDSAKRRIEAITGSAS